MKTVKKLALAMLISLAICNNTIAEDKKINEKTYRVNTLTLITEAAKNMPDCIEYCINKVVLKMQITIFGPVFYWTLNVSHNSPNWLSMAHPRLSETPYKDFNILFGKVYHKLTQTALTTLIPTGMKDIDAGRQRYKEFGDYQAVQSTEATVMGHPGSLIFAMFDIGGLKPDGYWVGSGKNRRWHQCQTHGCLEEKNTEIGEGIRQSRVAKKLSAENKKKLAGPYLTNWSKGIYTNTIYKIFDVKAVHDVLKNIQALNSFFQSFGQAFQTAAASVGARFDRAFCPMDIAPFAPYYLSGIDALSWRGGYPIADPEFTKTIMNPLSKDIIGAKINGIPETWSHIYPREGVVNINNTAKMAAVVTHRANSILADKKRSGIRIYRKPFENTVGVWNKIIPNINTTTTGAKKSACHKQIGNTGTMIHNDSTYAWTSWPRYSCDLASGITIAKIPFKKCLTSVVPD